MCQGWWSDSHTMCWQSSTHKELQGLVACMLPCLSTQSLPSYPLTNQPAFGETAPTSNLDTLTGYKKHIYMWNLSINIFLMSSCTVFRYKLWIENKCMLYVWNSGINKLNFKQFPNSSKHFQTYSWAINCVPLWDALCSGANLFKPLDDLHWGHILSP